MSDQRLLEWLKEDVDRVNIKVDILNAKIDDMLKFKWQIIGGSVVISAVLGIAIQLFLTAFGQKQEKKWKQQNGTYLKHYGLISL